MSAHRTISQPTIYPAIRYKDAPAAIEWLGRALGFEPHLVVPGPDGTIAHAELSFGTGMIMLGSAKDDNFRIKTPHDAGGVTQTLYVYTADPDSLYARAKAAGAEVIYELRNTEYGSREFAIRDPEGHFWSFGTYLPESKSTTK
jgi:uncharacterized glyoxalase superfamily protein PhnB